MRVTAFGEALDGDWSDPVFLWFVDYYVRQWPEWYEGQLLDRESLTFISEIACRPARMYWMSVARSLGPLDQVLRSAGVAITIELTDLVAGPESRSSREGEWVVRMPLIYFPTFYAAAACACEIEHEGWKGTWTLPDDAQGLNADPFERPFSAILMTDEQPPDIKYGKEAATIAVDALLIVTFHEIAHCLLAHHRASLHDTGEKRAMEVEADGLAGIFFAALDPRPNEQRKPGEPITWRAQDAKRFARALALLTVVTRWSDSKLRVGDEKRSHHRASTRAYHIGMGALVRFKAVQSPDMKIIEDEIAQAPRILFSYGQGTPLARYVSLEPEYERDWKSYETVTNPLQRQVRAKLLERRLPVLRRVLAGLRLQINDRQE